MPVVSLSTMPTRFLPVISGKGFGIGTMAFRNAANRHPFPVTDSARVTQPLTPLAYAAVRMCEPGVTKESDPSCEPPRTSCPAVNRHVPLAISPISEHSAGVNVVFCDGHGKFLSQEINPFVYAALLTPNGTRFGQSIVDGY